MIMFLILGVRVPPARLVWAGDLFLSGRGQNFNFSLNFNNRELECVVCISGGDNMCRPIRVGSDLWANTAQSTLTLYAS
uniref:Secreted protein n=1 Tax=Pararge aegeria TaxID=116150 RepID=S4NS79_9NEOP